MSTRCLLAVLVLCCIHGALCTTLWTGTFANDWMDNWGVKHGGIEPKSGTPGGGEVVEGDKLRVKYAPGEAGQSGVWMLAVPIDDLSSYRTLCLSYKLKVPTGYEFCRGGKLPGLYGTTGDTSLNSLCSGGDQPGPCYSARYMWRTDGDGEIYGYMPQPSSTVCDDPKNICNPDFGKSLGRGRWQFPADNQYHLYQQEITLNTGSSSNGRARVWVDGALKMDQEDLQWRRTDDIVHKGIFFNTFYGGSRSWGPTQTMYLYFGDFEISTSCTDSGTGTSPPPPPPAPTASPPTIAPPQGSALVNQVCINDAINTVSGSSVSVKVDYTSTLTQDMRVSLFTTSFDYISHTEVLVNAGSGSETVTVSSDDFRGTGFKIKVTLTPEGQSRRDETASKFWDAGETGCSDITADRAASPGFRVNVGLLLTIALAMISMLLL